MDWPRYKRLCDRPDHWSRWMLEQCVDLLGQLQEPELASTLATVLLGRALVTPTDHHGGPAVQMFVLRLTKAERLGMCHAIERASAAGLCTTQTATRGLGGFIEAWREYAAYEGPACAKS